MVLRFLVLGMLAITPMSGYALKKHFDATVAHFWAADRAQLYRTLAALVADGLATVQVVAQDNYPDRREHHITDAGRAALLAWLRSPLVAGDVRDPYLARLFFAGNLAPEEITALLDERRADAERVLRELIAEQNSHRAPPDTLPLALRLATLNNGIHHARAELEWLEQTKRSIRT